MNQTARAAIGTALILGGVYAVITLWQILLHLWPVAIRGL